MSNSSEHTPRFPGPHPGVPRQAPPASRPSASTATASVEVLTASYHVTLALSAAGGEATVPQLAQRSGLNSVQVVQAVDLLQRHAVFRVTGEPGRELVKVAD